MLETTIYTCRTFSAAHQLPDYNGPCANLHGHTWKVEVWIRGLIQCGGMVMDFKEVKNVIDTLDHKVLNDVMHNPTAEYVAWFIKKRLEDVCLPGVNVHKVRVWESENSYAEASDAAVSG